jgi:hypothetical protein
MTHSEIVSFIWGVADLIRDTFKRGKYQDYPQRRPFDAEAILMVDARPRKKGDTMYVFARSSAHAPQGPIFHGAKPGSPARVLCALGWEAGAAAMRAR